MLNERDGNMPELAYFEPDDESTYRLKQAFLTSYRLLMFLKLFHNMARTPGKSLVELRETLYDSHGAHPPGTSATIAVGICHTRTINNFPDFIKAMGIAQMPIKKDFRTFLCRTIKQSEEVGYSS
jgi:hypothetical protein